MNCSNLEKFGAMLEQQEFKKWDIEKNVLMRFIILNLFDLYRLF